MRVAVASRDGRTVAGHIGRCSDWIVFEAQAASADEPTRVKEVARISLPKEQVFHHYKDDGPHPLGDCAAVIGASGGEGFIAKMARRGIEAVLTAETDPTKAVAGYLGQRLTPPKPRPIGGIVCKIRDAISSGSQGQ